MKYVYDSLNNVKFFILYFLIWFRCTDPLAAANIIRRHSLEVGAVPYELINSPEVTNHFKLEPIYVTSFT